MERRVPRGKGVLWAGNTCREGLECIQCVTDGYQRPGGWVNVAELFSKANETQRPPCGVQLSQQIIETRSDYGQAQDTDRDEAEPADAVDMLDTYRLYKVKKNIPWRGSDNKLGSEFPKSYDYEIENAKVTDFKRLKGITYLDHAGTTLYSQRHLDAFYNDLSGNVYGNPHSDSESSRLSGDIVDRTRYRILQHFGVSAEDYHVVFTGGATAALQMVAQNFCFNNQRHNNEKTDSDVGGGFFYLLDNHTSVLGMRAVVSSRGHRSECVTRDEVDSWMSSPSALSHHHGNSLFAFPAQSNFSGQKYPLSWVAKVGRSWSERTSRCYVLLDAAAFVATSPLDLRRYHPDFVSVSFYKMFGFPTGLGALLVRQGSHQLLQKTYFGGGTVQVALARELYHVHRKNVSERFEDGTVSFLDIVALGHGFDALEKIAGSMTEISQHTFQLARYVHHCLASFRHSNGVAIATIYCDNDFEDEAVQGSIVTFNLRRADESFIGYAQVDQLAQLHNIHLRTGCFCNMGACQGHLQLTSAQIKDNFKHGHVCGDNMDVVNGCPTGAVRVSFGYMSTLTDAKTFIQFINDCFIDQQMLSLSSRPTEMSRNTGFKSSKHLTTAQTADQLESVQRMTTIPLQTELTTGQPTGTLTSICLYPIKSCAAFEVTEWPLEPQGLLYDRQWMIVNQSGVCVSQKREPRMCLLQPLVDCERSIMVLSFPGLDNIEIPLAEPQEGSTEVTTCNSRVCGDRVRGCEYGSEVSQWLSEALQQSGLRLVRQSTLHTRTSKKTSTGDTQCLSLANQAQFLLISEASVRSLAQHINSTQHTLNKGDLVSRFRANFVVDGFNALQERGWTRLCIGHHCFTSEGPCLRCQVICVDQSTGHRNKELLCGLSTFGERKLEFGILLHQTDSYEVGNHITVGDIITIES
ncbi:Molybdenum cofactor sulfurase [Lamellibrachia satsuma]|nr:Molybdenum cofactor sulfurase [Lamellibrachia satsuma]